MTKRYRAVVGRQYTAKDGSEKTAWTRIGTMWKRDKGGYSLQLDAAPIGDGRVMLFPDEDRQEHAPQNAGSYAAPSDSNTDDIPF